MQEKPPFSSYFDFFFYNVWEGDAPSHTHPLRTLILPSGTPVTAQLIQIIELTVQLSNSSNSSSTCPTQRTYSSTYPTHPQLIQLRCIYSMDVGGDAGVRRPELFFFFFGHQRISQRATDLHLEAIGPERCL